MVHVKAIGNGVDDIIEVVYEGVAELSVSKVGDGEGIRDVEGEVAGHQVVAQHRSKNPGVEVEGVMIVGSCQHWCGCGNSWVAREVSSTKQQCIDCVQ